MPNILDVFGRHLSAQTARQTGAFGIEVKQLPKLDRHEREVLTAFEKGSLKSVATKTGFAKLEAATRATAVKDRRVKRARGR